MNDSWYLRPAKVRARVFGPATVVFSAPHAGAQTRNGWLKPADSATGGLAETVAQLCRGRALTVSGYQLDDPNWDVQPGPFKNALLENAGPQSFVFDLHGMKPSHGVDICIGTGASPDAKTLAVAERAAQLAREMGFAEVRLNDPYAGRHPGTVTSFLQSKQIRCLEIEISSRYRDPKHSPENAERLVGWLLRLGRLAAEVGDTLD